MLLERLDLRGGSSGLAHQASTGRGGGGASFRYWQVSAPKRSSSLTYALGRSLLGRLIDVAKGWYVDVDENGFGRDVEKLELDCVEPIMIGRLGDVDGVEPRLDVNDIL